VAPGGLSQGVNRPEGRAPVCRTASQRACHASLALTTSGSLEIYRLPTYDGYVRTLRTQMREPTYFVLASLLDGPLHGYAIIQRTTVSGRHSLG
jgi:hypothetical protein